MKWLDGSRVQWGPAIGVDLARLESALAVWAGTPRADGVCVPGVGVDCYRHSWSVLASLRGEPAEFPKSLPLSVHKMYGPRLVAYMRAFARRFGRPSRLEIARPGTVIMLDRNGLTSLGIAGLHHKEVWHCNDRVAKIGWYEGGPAVRAVLAF